MANWTSKPGTADRLVATLLLLQARGHVTAGEVARELEVSLRRPGVTSTRWARPAIDRTRAATSRVVYPLGLAAKGETW